MDERVPEKCEKGRGVKEVSLELFLENLPLGVYFVVPDGRGVWRFTYVNKALADIAGYRPEGHRRVSTGGAHRNKRHRANQSRV